MGEPLEVYEAWFAGAAGLVPLLEHVGPFASRGPGCLTRDLLGWGPDGETARVLRSCDGRLAVTPMVRRVNDSATGRSSGPLDATSASTYGGKGVTGDMSTTASPTDSIHGAGRDRSLDVLTGRDSGLRRSPAGSDLSMGSGQCKGGDGHPDRVPGHSPHIVMQEV